MLIEEEKFVGLPGVSSEDLGTPGWDVGKQPCDERLSVIPELLDVGRHCLEYTSLQMSEKLHTKDHVGSLNVPFPLEELSAKSQEDGTLEVLGDFA